MSPDLRNRRLRSSEKKNPDCTRRLYIHDMPAEYGIDQEILDLLREFGLFPEILAVNAKRPFVRHREWVSLLHGLLKTHLTAAKAVHGIEDAINETIEANAPIEGEILDTVGDAV